MRNTAPALILVVLLAACEKKPTPVEIPSRLLLTATTFDALPGWREDPVAEALPALNSSCARISAQPDDRPVGPRNGGPSNGGPGSAAGESIAGRVADWRPACAALAQLKPGDDAALRAVLTEWFTAFKLQDNDQETGLVTGYYEAELRASPVATEKYRVPIYRRPPDLVTVKLGQFQPELAGKSIIGRTDGVNFVPYHARGAIDDGVLADKALELLWADDPVDVFFLHVQGSGRVLLPDGSTTRIGYDGSNGLKFFAIGRALINEGKISRKNASMQSIRDWLRKHPKEAAAMMQRNARYIFFRQIDGAGPIGAQGAALTAMRSLAIDPAFLPLGAPLYLATTWPGGDKPLARLMVAQDTGSAIKGPLRADFYWGSGEAALAQAGRMKASGTFYLLIPKAVAERQKPTS